MNGLKDGSKVEFISRIVIIDKDTKEVLLNKSDNIVTKKQNGNMK